EVRPGTARGGDAQRAAERGADGGADTGDLVLGLHGPDPEVLVLRQLVEDVRRRGDRVRPQEQREVGLAGRGDEPPRQAGVARDVGVDAGLEGSGTDLVVDLEQLGRLAEVVARLEGPG